MYIYCQPNKESYNYIFRWYISSCSLPIKSLSRILDFCGGLFIHALSIVGIVVHVGSTGSANTSFWFLYRWACCCQLYSSKAHFVHRRYTTLPVVAHKDQVSAVAYTVETPLAPSSAFQIATSDENIIRQKSHFFRWSSWASLFHSVIV